MKLDQLQHMVAIVQQGSLRSAARHLGVPQPALTRSVRSLEREVGAELFAREATGMVLTPIGKRFHLRAESIVHEAKRARDEVSQHTSDPQGDVVVALSIMPHVGMLPYALPVFRQRYPNVRLQIMERLFSDVERELRQGVIDFYLGAIAQVTPITGLSVRPLFENSRSVVCRSGHPLSGARSLAELADADWASTSVDYSIESDIVNVFRHHGLPPPHISVRANSAMSIMVALLHTDLLAMLPTQWVEFPITKGTLKVIEIREVLPTPGIVLVRRLDLPLTPAAEHFCEVLLRYCP